MALASVGVCSLTLRRVSTGRHFRLRGGRDRSPEVRRTDLIDVVSRLSRQPPSTSSRFQGPVTFHPAACQVVQARPQQNRLPGSTCARAHAQSSTSKVLSSFVRPTSASSVPSDDLNTPLELIDGLCLFACLASSSSSSLHPALLKF
ncbi:hypothetical protein CSOJ01_07254 [Colletotrichum sojae]|uniref:Uncharacterized protein n=1 Tax=Colletotrichum sojae TaxID=2175907 RepID=A0A8H6MTY8_9PEZI|nr:hypothetical protein CSOJ01_07254 [Colletotrichum sojae]